MPVKPLRSTCSTCKRNKSLIVSDQTTSFEGLGDFFKHIGKAAKNVGKKILNHPGRALKLAANIGKQQQVKIQNLLPQLLLIL